MTGSINKVEHVLLTIPIEIHLNGMAFNSYPPLALKVHIEVCDTELAYRALAKGEFAMAKKIFSGPFLPEKDERYAWRAPRFHGRALANVGLKDWDAALADIDTAIEAHRKDFDRKEDEPSASLLFIARHNGAICSPAS